MAYLPIIILIVFPILMFLSLAGGADNPCNSGYHWVEDVRQTTGGCVRD